MAAVSVGSSATRHPQTTGLLVGGTGCIADILWIRSFDSGVALEAMLGQYIRLKNHHVLQKAIGHDTPGRKLKEWQTEHPDLFGKSITISQVLTSNAAVMTLDSSSR